MHVPLAALLVVRGGVAGESAVDIRLDAEVGVAAVVKLKLNMKN